MGFIEELLNGKKWAGLKSIVMVEAIRRIATDPRPTPEKRYYISSLPLDAQCLADAIRTHWNIENSLYRVLDVALLHKDGGCQQLPFAHS